MSCSWLLGLQQWVTWSSPEQSLVLPAEPECDYQGQD